MAAGTVGLEALGDLVKQISQEEKVEMDWAMKAHHHAEAHMKIITAFDPAKLRLTSCDDDIYRHFKRRFKNMKIDVLNPEDLKSEEAKVLWRPFCQMYKDKILHFNYGTLLRIDCSKDYSPENTIFATKIQFLAIEIARNRQNLNNFHLKQQDAEQEAQQDDAEDR